MIRTFKAPTPHPYLIPTHEIYPLCFTVNHMQQSYLLPCIPGLTFHMHRPTTIKQSPLGVFNLEPLWWMGQNSYCRALVSMTGSFIWSECIVSCTMDCALVTVALVLRSSRLGVGRPITLDAAWVTHVSLFLLVAVSVFKYNRTSYIMLLYSDNR